MSKDTGFDAVVEIWEKHNINVSRICSLEDKNEQKEEKNKKKKETSDIQKATKEELLKYLAEKEYTDNILKIVNSYKTKTAINNGFIALYKDTTKAGIIYNKIKPLLKEKGKK